MFVVGASCRVENIPYRLNGVYNRLVQLWVADVGVVVGKHLVLLAALQEDEVVVGHGLRRVVPLSTDFFNCLDRACPPQRGRLSCESVGQVRAE